MRRFSLLFLILFASFAYSYDVLQDVRYTLGSEYQSIYKLQFGVGLHTSFDSEATVPIQLQGRLSKYFEIGSKIILEKQNNI